MKIVWFRKRHGAILLNEFPCSAFPWAIIILADSTTIFMHCAFYKRLLPCVKPKFENVKSKIILKIMAIVLYLPIFSYRWWIFSEPTVNLEPALKVWGRCFCRCCLKKTLKFYFGNNLRKNFNLALTLKIKKKTNLGTFNINKKFIYTRWKFVNICKLVFWTTFENHLCWPRLWAEKTCSIWKLNCLPNLHTIYFLYETNLQRTRSRRRKFYFYSQMSPS